jgi:hypothetical protein
MTKSDDGRSHNQPSHEAQVKGGQHSHQNTQSQQGEAERGDRGPSHEAQVKGGQHSHSGSQK